MFGKVPQRTRAPGVHAEKQQLFTAMFDTDMDEINLAARSRVEEMRELVASLPAEGTDE